jgi:hypothetical protein
VRRTDAAVDADHVGPLRLQRGHELLGRRAVEAVPVLLDRHLRNHRQRADAADRRNRRAELVHVAKRLEDEQVHAPVGQRFRLFAEIHLRFVRAGLPPWLDADAERPHRAGNVGLAGGGATR